MALRRKKKRLATQAEKDAARRNGESVPTYVYVETSSSSYGGYDGGSHSSSSCDSGGSSSSCGGGGGCD